MWHSFFQIKTILWKKYPYIVFGAAFCWNQFWKSMQLILKIKSLWKTKIFFSIFYAHIQKSFYRWSLIMQRLTHSVREAKQHCQNVLVPFHLARETSTQRTPVNFIDFYHCCHLMNIHSFLPKLGPQILWRVIYKLWKIREMLVGIELLTNRPIC
jgi:hypothetical protein